MSSMYLSQYTPTPPIFFFFFFNDTATTEIYTLSLHDALPIYRWGGSTPVRSWAGLRCKSTSASGRSEEHTSELQSRLHLVCRLLLEKKKKRKRSEPTISAITGIHKSYPRRL